MRPSPITRLNRAVAVLKVRGAEAALAELDEIESDAALDDYHLLPATRALMLWAAGRSDEAAGSFDEAVRGARTVAERRLLGDRARRCREGEAPPPF